MRRKETESDIKFDPVTLLPIAPRAGWPTAEELEEIARKEEPLRETIKKLHARRPFNPWSRFIPIK